MTTRSKPQDELWAQLEPIIDAQLRLQVDIAYSDHLLFIENHSLADCARVVDFGTGNGYFLRRLSGDHPTIHFVGADRRENLLAKSSASEIANLDFINIDLVDEDFAQLLHDADGVLMRYFLLHVPDARQILAKTKNCLRDGSRVWIIDVNLSKFHCEPNNTSFQLISELVNEYCQKYSIDSLAGQKIGALLEELNFKEIISVDQPFTSRDIDAERFSTFLKQEVHLYSTLLGRHESDPKTKEIYRFIDTATASGHSVIDYGMILWTAVV